MPLSGLSDYEKERLPVARQVLRGTDFVSRLALLPENWLKRFVRGTLLAIAVRSPFLQRRVLTMISEVGVARREIHRYVKNKG
jgi:2-polyprenyl-6-methoxyphenol hydroxylase-like FAD-dependent oxidoreductase